MSILLPDLETLTLRQQVAQMVVVRASGYLFDHQIRYPQWEPPLATLTDWLTHWGVGGVILLGGSAAELALRIQQLQELAPIPLLVAADVEEGVGQRFPGATWFPPPMALGAIAQTDQEAALHLAREMGRVTAQEAHAIGLNWVLAPVTDVNNNPANPVINIRAFGETPELVSAIATAFIQGAKAAPVLTVAKHFPGHGDTAVDSHFDLPTVPHAVERLRQIELPPFQAAIAAGVDSVMTAHLRIPALDATYPATLSDRLLTKELRQRLGFEGLIVTDALIMGAIANTYGPNEAAVLAVEAGADILLMPGDPVGAIQAVCQAVEEGRITATQIRATVERIWHAKQTVCCPPVAGATSHTWETVTPSIHPHHLTSHLAHPNSHAIAETILQRSLRARVPQPLATNPAPQARNLIMIDNALNSKEVGHQSPAIAIPARYGYQVQVVDENTPTPCVPTPSDPPQPTLLQLFIRGNPFRGQAGLTQRAQVWFDYLLHSQQLQALVIYGSPYVLDEFLPHLPPDLPYVFTYGQMPAAQAIALQTLWGTPPVAKV